jgi:pSer/pThr/pTyr-binding forkhead associated (FHA) protein
MQDGHTVKRRGHGAPDGGLAGYLERYDPVLVVVRGGVAGEEHPLDAEKLVIGRGPDVDLAFDDEEMSSQHAAVEFAGEGFRLRDLGSTNGSCVNGKPVQAVDLATGDRIALGRVLLQLRIEERQREPRVYLVPDD